MKKVYDRTHHRKASKRAKSINENTTEINRIKKETILYQKLNPQFEQFESIIKTDGKY